MYYDEVEVGHHGHSRRRQDPVYSGNDHPSSSSNHGQTGGDDGHQAVGDLKGWRESGYKIVTEVEYVDKGE